MISLTHPVTGHQLSTDDDSVEFWEAAGYQAAAEKKAPAKKSTSRKSSTTKK